MSNKPIYTWSSTFISSHEFGSDIANKIEELLHQYNMPYMVTIHFLDAITNTYCCREFFTLHIGDAEDLGILEHKQYQKLGIPCVICIGDEVMFDDMG